MKWKDDDVYYSTKSKFRRRNKNSTPASGWGVGFMFDCIHDLRTFTKRYVPDDANSAIDGCNEWCLVFSWGAWSGPSEIDINMS